MTNKELKWAKAYINLAKQFANDVSDDPSTKIGAVIVSPRNRIVSIGVNGFPEGVRHSEERYIRPIKYKYMEHAERNAIYSANCDLQNCVLYLSTYPCPCADCARAIIQSGIVCVVGPSEEYLPSKNPDSIYNTDIDISSPTYIMLGEAGVKVCVVDFEKKIMSRIT